MFDYVQWYFVVNDGKGELIEYLSDINVIIEKVYCNNDKEVWFQNDVGIVFIINFKNMMEYFISDLFDVVIVVRKGIYVLYFF